MIHISPTARHNLVDTLLDTYEGVRNKIFLYRCEICDCKELTYYSEGQYRAYEECLECDKCICSHYDLNMNAWIEDNGGKSYVCNNCQNDNINWKIF